LPHSNAVV